MWIYLSTWKFMKLNEYSVTDGEDFIVPNEVCSMGSLHVWGEDEPTKNNIEYLSKSDI